jgi:hypothetical protein
MELITKEYLNGKDPFGYNLFLKVDIPIWEEFTIGLVRRAGWATNNNFSGVRSIMCKYPNSEKYREVFVVTNNEKSKRFFKFVKDGFTIRDKEMYKNLDIKEYRRENKNVYVIEFEYND